MRHVHQDKMKKVLDLWSKNSTFPVHYLAKLKGLVSGGDYLTAQGAYNFEHPFPVQYILPRAKLHHVPRVCRLSIHNRTPRHSSAQSTSILHNFQFRTRKETKRPIGGCYTPILHLVNSGQEQTAASVDPRRSTGASMGQPQQHLAAVSNGASSSSPRLVTPPQMSGSPVSALPPALLALLATTATGTPGGSSAPPTASTLVISF